MRKIDGTPKTVRELFTAVKYTLHYYQREYRWGKKQVEELLEDLTSEFLEFYDEQHSLKKVPEYGHYFLGSIVLTEDELAIIDGQQRLTTLMLLLIYLYHHLEAVEDKAEVLNLFWFKKSGEWTFAINDPDREPCLLALKKGDETFVLSSNAPESVRNIYARYQELDDLLPDEVKNGALLYFKDWLLDNVDLIRIIAKTEQDAHKIFVSMNDRGLSLTATEMLKGFLLSEIADDDQRNHANDVWKETMLVLNDLDKNGDADFIKSWLRAQYADTIRETKKGAENEDWDLLGTSFHKWVRENTDKIGINNSDEYYCFVTEEMVKFAEVYGRLINASVQFDPNYEYVFYNANREFTLQYQLILAAIDPKNKPDTIERKIKVVSCFVDQYIALRVFNYKRVGYNDRKNDIFKLTKKIRRKPLPELVDILIDEINQMDFKIEGIQSFGWNLYTSRYILHFLARLTYYVEMNVGRDTHFEDYVDRTTKNPYDIEHIWPDHYDWYSKQFSSEEEFNNFRNKFGGLLILPRDINRSLQDKKYEKKLDAYNSQNLLARSLNSLCYQNNPQFKKFMGKFGLTDYFKPLEHFNRDALQKRQDLYQELAARIWDPEIMRSFLE